MEPGPLVALSRAFLSAAPASGPRAGRVRVWPPRRRPRERGRRRHDRLHGQLLDPAGLVGARAASASALAAAAHNRLTINGRDNDVVDPHGLMGGLVAPGTLLWRPLRLRDRRASRRRPLRVKALRQETPQRWEVLQQPHHHRLHHREPGSPPRELPGDRRRRRLPRGHARLLRHPRDSRAREPYESKLEHEVDAISRRSGIRR